MAIFNSYVKLPEGTTGYSTALFIDSTYSQFQIIKHVYAHVLSPSGYGSKIYSAQGNKRMVVFTKTTVMFSQMNQDLTIFKPDNTP